MMSARAQRRRSRGVLAAGIIIMFIYIMLTSVISFASGIGNPELGITARLIAAAIFTAPIGLISLVLLCIGIVAEFKAHKINGADWAQAEAVARECGALLALSPTEAYRSPDNFILAPHSLIEVERHFDQKTAGEVRGAVAHRFSMFGSSFGHTVASRSGYSASSTSIFGGTIRGLSDVHLSLDQTTRSDLMGDAIFALFEIRDQQGHSDTVRLTALSNAAVSDWIYALISQTAIRFGLDTHTGVTVAAYAGQLANHFGPGDVSYLSDRLHLIQRNGGDTDDIRIAGLPSGRNALVAVSALLNGNNELFVFPLRFPAMWGEALGKACSRPAIEQPKAHHAIESS